MRSNIDDVKPVIIELEIRNVRIKLKRVEQEESKETAQDIVEGCDKW